MPSSGAWTNDNLDFRSLPLLFLVVVAVVVVFATGLPFALCDPLAFAASRGKPTNWATSLVAVRKSHPRSHISVAMPSPLAPALIANGSTSLGEIIECPKPIGSAATKKWARVVLAVEDLHRDAAKVRNDFQPTATAGGF